MKTGILRTRVSIVGSNVIVSSSDNTWEGQSLALLGQQIRDRRAAHGIPYNAKKIEALSEFRSA